MKLLTTLALALTVTTAVAQSPDLLKQWDAAAAKFKSAEANVTYETYTRAARATDTQTGSLYIERTPKGQSMGAVYKDPGSKVPAKIIRYDGGTLHMYTPGTNQDDIFKAGDNRGKYESFLTLGFGGSGTDLAKSWTIKHLGPETINGTKTEKLDLVSKDPSVQSTFTHVTIWIDPAQAISIKQQFFAPGGDTRTATYSNFKLGQSINKKPYAIPSKAQPINH